MPHWSSLHRLDVIGVGMANHTVRVLGTFTTKLTSTLLDVATSRRFVTEVLRTLQGPPIALVAQDIASALEQYGHVPGEGERGVFAAAYASLAGATVRTLPGEGRARIDVHSYAHPVEPADLHALVWRHYATRELELVDLGRWG